PQANHIRPQLALHLLPMQIHRHLERAEHVFPEQSAVTGLDIEQLDGEDIRRVPQLIEGKKQGRGMTLARPPRRCGMERCELGGAQPLEHAEHIQVGMLRLIVAGGCRPVEHHQLQVGSRGPLELLDEFRQILLHRPRFLSRLPASTGATAPEASSAKSAEPPGPSEAASAPATPSGSPPTSHWTREPPSAGPLASSVSRATYDGLTDKGQEIECEENSKKDEQSNRPRGNAEFRLSRSRRGLIRERHAAVLGDHSGNARGQQKERAAIIPLDKQRYHLAPEPAYLAIRQDRFEAVAD